MNVTEWLSKANEAIQQLDIGKKFETRNLFLEYEWESLSKGERIYFGKYFKAEVIEGRISGVQYLDRKKNNHALYIKTDEGD